MSKQVAQFSLSLFAKHISEWAAARADVNAMHAILREAAPKLTSEAQRVEVDHLVVKALAKRYGVVATTAEKNGRLSMLTFAKAKHADDAEKYALYHRAAEALNAARNRFIKPKLTAPVTPVEAAKNQLVKLLNSDTHGAEAKRAIRQLMNLVVKQ